MRCRIEPVQVDRRTCYSCWGSLQQSLQWPETTSFTKRWHPYWIKARTLILESLMLNRSLTGDSPIVEIPSVSTEDRLPYSDKSTWSHIRALSLSPTMWTLLQGDTEVLVLTDNTRGPWNGKHTERFLQTKGYMTCYPPRGLGADMVVDSVMTFVFSV